MNPTWTQSLDAWTTHMRAASQPATTIAIRTYHVRRFATSHPDTQPATVTLDTLTAWLAGHAWAVETRRSHRASLRSFYAWTHATGRCTTNPAAQLPPITPPITRPRPAPEDVVITAIGTASGRVRLMLELASSCGMRRGEIAQAHTRDIERDLDGWNLRIHGKGRKERLVPLNDWIAVKLRRMPPGYLFPGRDHGHLSAHYTGKLMSRALADGWTAHSLRHRFAARVYEAERDIRAVQELLGHASVRTTQLYTPVPAGALRTAIRAAA